MGNLTLEDMSEHLFISGIRTRFKAIIQAEIEAMITDLRKGLDKMAEKAAHDFVAEVSKEFNLLEPQIKLNVMLKPLSQSDSEVSE